MIIITALSISGFLIFAAFRVNKISKEIDKFFEGDKQ